MRRRQCVRESRHHDLCHQPEHCEYDDQYKDTSDHERQHFISLVDMECVVDEFGVVIPGQECVQFRWNEDEKSENKKLTWKHLFLDTIP